MVVTFTFTFREFSRSFYLKRYDKYICQKKEKQQYVAVGTLRMFINKKNTNNNKIIIIIIIIQLYLYSTFHTSIVAQSAFYYKRQ